MDDHRPFSQKHTWYIILKMIALHIHEKLQRMFFGKMTLQYYRQQLNQKLTTFNLLKYSYFSISFRFLFLINSNVLFLRNG